MGKAIREREGHLDTLRASLAQARALLDLGDPGDHDHDPVSEPRLAATKQGLLCAMSLKNPSADNSRARGALRALVPGRIVFHRDPDGTWTFEGKPTGAPSWNPWSVVSKVLRVRGVGHRAHQRDVVRPEEEPDLHG
jgi:hypothetical protein